MDAARDSDAPPAMPAPGDRIGERYRVESVLGQGAAGIVFAASHDYTGRDVAIKWLHPHVAADVTLAQRFLREARAAASVQHPNVVEILDAGRDRGTFYLVMERLEGELLSAALARKDLGVPAIARIFLTLMRGVSAAHELGIVHRDLKPENVFLCPPTRGRPGGAKVLDFGISKFKRTTPDGGELTQAGVFIGSPYYMAPEQIADSRAVDPRADVYSIGVMLYEALTHRLPFDAPSLSALFAKVMSERPYPIEELRPDLPAALCDLVTRAMSADPKGRFTTVHEMADALEPFAQGLRFAPGGDAFDVAWRERASIMMGERMSFSDLPPMPSDGHGGERTSDPSREAPVHEDAAASAVARVRERAAQDALPDQPTVIKPQGERSSPYDVPAAARAHDAGPGDGGDRPTIEAPAPSEALAGTPTVMADPGALAPVGPTPRPYRSAEPTEAFLRPPTTPAPSLGRALAPWIVLAIVTALVMLAAGVALGRLL